MANKPQPNFEFCKNYGENYKRLRTDKGLTQKELAKALNIVHSTISDIEKSKNPPTIEQLQAYHKYFGVSYEYLLGETYVMKPDLQLICEYTGLSENAVEKLHEFYTAEYGHRYVERVNKSVEIEGIENCPEFNDYAMNFINHLITDDDFANIIKRAVKLKEDIAEMKATIPDDESNEQAQMLLTRQNRKILLRAKKFVVTDNGYIDLMKEKMKSIFGTILDHIIDK